MAIVDDLIAFLRARLDEDEQAAQQVLSFEADGFKWEYQWARHGRYQGRVTRSSFEPGAPSPRRVLAEVEAKREILDEYRLWADDDSRDYDQSQTAVDRTAALEEVVKLLAQPYADHADFRSEWRREV
jgi:hypothetical protein